MAFYDTYLERLQKILHSVLDNGIVGEIQKLVMKENKSAAIIFLSTVVWFVFQVRGWHLITVLSKLLFYLILFFSGWSLAADKGLIKWKPASFNEIMISETTAMSIFKKSEGLLAKFYDIVQGKDLKFLLTILVALFLMPYISNRCSFPTFIYLAFVLCQIVPILRKYR